MAVVVVVEDGTVVANANSYVSVAETTAYLEANTAIFATWNALSADDKAALVVWSTRYLDQRARWRGTKTDADSSLRWPREGVYDRDGEAVDSDEIPEQLKQAVMEMARYLMSGDRAIERGTDGLTRLKVDVIELEFDETYRLPEVPNEINVILQGLGSLSSGTFPRFPRISKS